MPKRATPGWPRERWLQLDQFWARRLHRAALYRPLLWVLLWTSMLGDGLLWCLLSGLLPFLYGVPGRQCALAMWSLGAANLLLYEIIKHSICRPRPFMQCPDIQARARALDRFSFPSGHTMHAVSFSLLIGHFFPTWSPLLWSLTGLIALSRVVLGLHYPSDVLAAAVIGALTSGLGILLFG
jgi:undecaprenyl-diphosphatase